MTSAETLPAAVTVPHGVRDIYLTSSGEAFVEENPDVFGQFLEDATTLITPKTGGHAGYEHIGSGQYGFVYGASADPESCIKIAAQHTHRRASKQGSHAKLPDLALEARFMDRIHRYLGDRPEGDVKAPPYYAVASFAGASALLMGRVPEEYATPKAMFLHASDEETDMIYERATAARKHVESALAGTVLRHGARDLRGKAELVVSQFNNGNLFLRTDLPEDSEDVYVIDLIRPRRALLARTALLLAGLE